MRINSVFLKNFSVNLTARDLEKICSQNRTNVDAALNELKKAVEKEKIEQEKLKKIQV